MTKSYAVPDRSNFTPNEHRDDPLLPEGDLGASYGELPGNRPFVMEHWFSEGFSYITLFFSTLDLEGAEPEQLMALIAPVLSDAKVPEEHRWITAKGIHVIADAAKQPMYSLTFCVGEPPY